MLRKYTNNAKKATRHLVLSILVLAILIIPLVVNNQPAVAFAGGNGTSGNPYQITNQSELASLNSYLGSGNSNVYFKLMNDISLSGSWTPIGNSSSNFYGKFDGDNKTISGLTINSTAGQYQGLFGFVATGGQVANINVTGASVTITSPQSFTYVGVIAGQNSGTISGSSSTGTVTGGNHYNGGIAGINYGTISNSYSTAAVTGFNYSGGITGYNAGTISGSYSTGTINCTNLNGGITGMSAGGAISDSYSRSTISGSIRAAGAVGYLTGGTVSNVYSTGAVTGSTNSGGLVGQVSGGTVSNSYWDTETSGRATSAAGTGKTTSEMKTQGTFSGWNFSTTWGIDGGGTVNNGYPYLLWQVSNSSPNTPTSLGASNVTSGGALSNTQPGFSFSLSDPNSSDTLSFQIQIDDSSNFGSPLVDYTSSLAAQGSRSFTVGQAVGGGSYAVGSSGQSLSDGTYYWRVRATDNSSANSAYATANSGSAAFIVDTVAPSTPGLPSTTSPTNDNTPLLSWAGSTDSGSGVSSYNVQWSTVSNYASYSLISTGNTSTSYAIPTSLSDGTWYFRVQANDAASNSSSFTGSKTVVIDTAAPAKSGTVPNDNASGVSKNTSLTIAFNEIVNAGSGNITIYRSSDDSVVEAIASNSSQVLGSGSTTLSISLSSALAYSTSYYVKIASGALTDSAGNSYAGIASSTTWNFTTEDAPKESSNNSSGNSTSGSSSSRRNLGSSASSTTATTNTEAADTTTSQPVIILNNFKEYLTGSGKKLQLYLKQVVFFKVEDQQHSATVQEIGSDYAVVTLASTPRNVTIGVGETRQFDINNDGRKDLEISLLSVNNDLADIKFKQISHKNLTGSAALPITEPGDSGIQLYSLTMGLVVVILLILGLKQRRTQKH